MAHGEPCVAPRFVLGGHLRESWRDVANGAGAWHQGLVLGGHLV